MFSGFRSVIFFFQIAELTNSKFLYAFQSTASSITCPIVINKNMSLRFCNSAASAAGQPVTLHQPVTQSQQGRPLVVMLAWLMAREKYLEKYRSIYFQHGFDVLTVKTSPLELMLPRHGSQQVAKHLLDFLRSKVPTYPNVVIHGFSVGAYQFAEMLVLLEKGLFGKDGVDSSCEIVKNSIKGMVFDSAVGISGAPHGVAVSLVGKNLLSEALERLIRGYLALMYPIATKYHIKAEKTFLNTPLRCPAMLLVGHDDKLGNPTKNMEMRDRWKELGLDVTWKSWPNTQHVAHFQRHPEEYTDIIASFLRKLHLNRLPSNH